MVPDFETPLVDVESRIAELEKKGGKDADSSELAELKRKLQRMLKSTYSKLSPWQTVQVARHADRPLLRDYIDGMFTDFVELHGDRCFADDPALVGGFATIAGRKVMVIGMDKGRSTEDKIRNNFGMANPDGYRKALRLMKLAEKYHLPIVCLVDTPAAFPGREAEERGQAEAIATNLTEMAALEVPIIVVVTGEGGSGGALGIAVGDVVMMLSNSVYSVIPPEGCAAILWRDASMAPEAAAALKVTAESLLELGIINEIIPEPLGGAHRDPATTIAATAEAIARHLKQIGRQSGRKLVDKRYRKYTSIGRF